MALSLPYDITASGGISPYQVQQDLVTLANKFGNIQVSDLGSGFTLPASQLSASLSEQQIVFSLGAAAAYTTTGYIGAPIAFGSTINAATYNVKAIIMDALVGGTTGTVAPTFRIDFGTIAGSVFTSGGTFAAAAFPGSSTTGAVTTTLMTVGATTVLSPTHLRVFVTAGQTGSQTYLINFTIVTTRSLQ